MSDLRSDSSLNAFKKALELDRVPKWVWEGFWTFIKKSLHKKWHEMNLEEHKQLWTEVERYAKEVKQLSGLLDDRDEIKEQHYNALETLLRKASKQIPQADDTPSSSRSFYDPARDSAVPEGSTTGPPT